MWPHTYLCILTLHLYTTITNKEWPNQKRFGLNLPYRVVAETDQWRASFAPHNNQKVKTEH